MPIIDTPAGTLEVQNAILSASEFRGTQKISVSNSAPTKNFSVGDKFHVSTTDADAVNITGNLVAQKLKIGNLLVSPTFDLAAVSNVGNTTSNTLQFANATTSFVASSNVEIGGNITLTSNAQVKVGSNVLAEYTGPHGREPKEVPLKKYPEIAFDASKFDKNDTTNTYTQAGYTVTASSQYDGGAYAPWEMYVPGTGPLTGTHYWSNHSTQLYNAYSGGTLVSTSGHTQTVVSSVTYNGIFTTIQLPHKIKLNSIDIQSHNASYFPHSGIIAGSTNGSSWDLIHSFSELSTPDTPIIENIITNSAGNTNHYNYFRLIITKGNGTAYIGIRYLRWNGYEEPAPVGDLSLDTTLKSTFNSVRSNNYVMYFDGDGFDPNDTNSNNLVTGSSVSVIHHNATYDTTEKYWTLDGSTESNVTTGSLGFEGDAPHTVSTWINASNLEANALTQQLFSIGSGYSEEIVRVDDTQIAANTWHNVTYAYQGEGGSKVTYVDGRKVEEAQAEDTFGDYPPFAMTDYETGGYVVNSSSQSGDSRNFFNYKAFNGIYGSGTGDPGVGWNSWSDWVSPNGYNGGSGAYSGNKRLASETVQGEWLSIKFPHKLIVSQFAVHPQHNTNALVPTSGYIYGKNGSSSWEVISNWTDLQSSTLNTPMNIFPNTYGKAYEEFALVGTKRYAGDGASISIGEWIFRGHKEGDLTRFPEPTRVLKYPHIAMTGPGQRGYVASASGTHTNGNHAVFKAFDGDITNDWQIDGGRYTDSGGGVYTHNAGETTVTNVQSRVGDWVQLESPHKIRVKTMKFTPIATYGQERSPATGVLVGSNDNGSTWTEIKVFGVTADGTPTSYTAGSPTTLAIDSGSNSTPGYYKIHRLIWLTLYTASQTTYADRASVADLEFYGTQENTGTPAIVGGPFAGKVANFRVYDQYLGDERIQEIYDAQKDEFGHKKSSMTLYKGRVGVGTTEPEGALTVIDEPHALAKFPARAVSADDSYDEGIGHIKLSTADGSGFNAFDGLTSTSWDSAPGINTRVSEEVDFGAWLKIQTPESISIKKAEIQSNAHWYQVGSEIAGSSTSDHFGVSVACNHNGTRIMASGSRVNSSAGRVRVYEYQDGAGTASADWVQIGQDLTGANETGARFGASVAMSGDGNIIAIGAPFEHANGLGDSGTVRVFYLVGSTWTLLSDSGSETLSVGASNVLGAFVGPAVNDELGRAVKLSYDGKTLAFNITNEDEGGTDRGQVRVLTYANGAWTNKGSGINGTTNSQQFGLAIDMSDDGDHLIIGANNTAPNPPEVRVFKWDGSSWGLKGSILNHTTSTDAFGHAVAISNDGSVIALGIRNADITDGADADNRGIVRMYHWSGSSWTLKNTLEYPYKEATNRDDDFGTTVNLSGDGKRLIVSSPWSDESGDSSGAPGGTAGQLWVYEYYAGNWSLRRPVPYTSAPTFDGYQSSARTNAGGIGLMGNTDSVLGAGIENDYWSNMNVATLGGQSIAISRDGAAIIAGEWAYNSSSAGGDRGRVRVWSMPSNIKSIWGSNDDVNWTKIVSGPTREEATSNVAGLAFGFSEMAKFTNIDNPNYYKYHAIVADAFTSLKDIKLFGIRNQGSSTLHDGALTLTKNLDVPRIGPPLDADDTPRRDRLVVEYNTSTNPVEDGLVRDTSGRGNDGVLYGGAVYDATQKAFEFDGTDDYVSVKASGVKGSSFNTSYSFSIWIRMTNTASAAVFITVGTSASGEMIGLRMSNGTTQYLVYHFAGDSATTGTTYGVSQQWRHVALTWDNSHQRIYIDGVLAVEETASSSFLNIPDNPNINLGMRPDGGGSTEYFKGYQSNPKIYDCTLTAEEVKTLYDMGRTGSVANPQPLHIAAPLYAPGTICQVGIVPFPRENKTISNGTTATLTTFYFKPKFANSRLFFTLTIYVQTANNYWNIWLYRNDSDRITSHSTGTYGITGQNYSSVGGGHQVRVGQGYDEPNTTESQKYSVMFASGSGGDGFTLGVNGPHLLKIEEICQ